MGADALSDVLRAVRLTGAVFFNLDVKAPWVAETPSATQCVPLRDARRRLSDRVSRRHARQLLGRPDRRRAGATAGRRHHRLSARRRARALEQAGHALQTRHGVSSKAPRRCSCPSSCSSAATDRTKPASSAAFSAATRGRSTRCSRRCRASCTCPRSSPHRSAWLNHIVQAAVDESVNKRSGGESVLGRLSELMFIEVVRSYIQTLSAEETGWLAGLADRHVASALNAMHGKPSQAWTLEDLAKTGRPLALGVRRTLHAGARTAADPVSHRMAHAACDRPAGQHQGQHRAGRRPGRLRIRGRLQPRLQEADRHAAGGMARAQHREDER